MKRLTLTMLLLTTVAASPQEVTVMQLRQNPRQYTGQRVTVSGYYYSDFEGHAIFADRKAAEQYDSQRGIWVAADPNVESPVRKAQVIGVFVYSSTALRHGRGIFIGGYGPFGSWPVALVNATVHLKREATSAPNQTMQRTPTRPSRHISHD
jgi:hypothetical protein